ncbi:unnamed protein product [Hapterophycus canaliculatus]
MLLRYLLVAFLAAASGVRDSSSARRMSRTPLAVGALSGLRFIHEPYLLEFHGAKCDHCEEMLPLFDRLHDETRLVIKRHLVWEDTANFRLMAIYDLKTGCKGLPFFYNRRTGETICGATTWSNFRNWALDRKCQTFKPPRVTPEQEEDAKPKKLEQDPLFTRLKRGLGRSKVTTPKLDEYGE